MDKLQGSGFYTVLPCPEGLSRVVPAPLQPQIEQLMVCCQGWGLKEQHRGQGLGNLLPTHPLVQLSPVVILVMILSTEE